MNEPAILLENHLDTHFLQMFLPEHKLDEILPKESGQQKQQNICIAIEKPSHSFQFANIIYGGKNTPWVGLFRVLAPFQQGDLSLVSVRLLQSKHVGS